MEPGLQAISPVASPSHDLKPALETRPNRALGQVLAVLGV